MIVAGRLGQILRYGENPHQMGAFYRTGEPRPGVASARQLHGKELSYNNYADADAAFELVAEFAPPAVAIVKHANPCGVAVAASLRAAWDRALACDPAERLWRGRGAQPPARSRHGRGDRPDLCRDRDRPRGRAASRGDPRPQDADCGCWSPGRCPTRRRRVSGFARCRAGFWSSSATGSRSLGDGLRTVTRRAPSEAEIADLRFADTVAKHVKSNAIVFARDGATVGIGAGQPSRVDSVQIAARKAADMGRAAGLQLPPTEGAVLASDAFFPFADGLEAAIAAGITAAIQPGGSVRDPEVIAAADLAGIAMVFSGLRHFRH